MADQSHTTNPTERDPEIMRLYAEWTALAEQSEANDEAGRGLSFGKESEAIADKGAAIEQERVRLEYAIAEIPAATMADVRLKLGLAAHWMQEFDEPDTETALALSAHRDLERLATA